ncbi:hypothetical protein BRADI_4g01905v3 [Brachypodium distachyon]|uniref:Uncharacterized protein n=1 Tax=Brachypodium distachyon TaxID=15368 RepID=A0A0Q3HCM1_BRADI|nr:hypothetical protein BRADI_4g01905v3 [Brachypodium distachyon]
MAAKFIRSIPGSQEPLDSPYQERDKEGSTAHCSTMGCRILSYAVSSPSSYAFLGQLLDQIYRGRETREMLRESRRLILALEHHHPCTRLGRWRLGGRVVQRVQKMEIV